MGDYVKIDALNEDALFPAYVAAPSDNARAAIIVIPEIFGVNAGIRQKCDLLAAAGSLRIHQADEALVPEPGGGIAALARLVAGKA